MELITNAASRKTHVVSGFGLLGRELLCNGGHPDDANLQHYYREPRLGDTMCKTCERREQPGRRA